MIRLDRVSFTYAGAVEPALRELSFQIEESCGVGVIGAAGAGK